MLSQAADAGRFPQPSDVAPKLALPVERLIDAVVIGSALVFGSKLLPLVLTGGMENAPSVRLAFFAIYLLFLGLLLRQTESLIAMVRYAPVLVLTLAFPLLSTLWSIDPGETLERSVALLGSSLIGVHLALCLPLRRTVRLLAIASTLSAGLSFLAIVAAPQIGIAQSGPWAGTWVGLHAHKNGLGTMSLLGAFLCGYAFTDARRAPWLRLFLAGGMVVNVVLLFGSHSLTAVLVFVGVVGFAVTARMMQRAPGATIVLLLTAATAAGAAAADVITVEVLERIIEKMGRNSTLSSRLPIWETAWPYAVDRMWAGFGYEAFWNPERGWSRHFVARLGFLPFYSHNGFLELMLAGGVLLVMLAAALLATALARSVVLALRWRADALATLPLVIVLGFMARNVTEASFLERNNLEWVLFVAVYMFLACRVRISFAPPAASRRA